MRGDLDDVFLRGRLLASMTQRELAAVPGLTQVAEMPDGSRQVSDERSGWFGVIPASPDRMRVVINPQQGSQQPPTLREGVGTGAPLLAPSGPTMDAAAPVPAAVPAEDVEAAAAAPTTPTRHAVPGRPDPLHDPEGLWWAGEAARGVLHGVNNTAEAFLEATRLGQFADWLEEQIPLGRVEYKLPETAVGEIAAGGAQVVAGMVPAMRVVRGIARLKGVLGASANFIRWSRWTAGGAIADALGWDEDEPTVFNLLKEMEPYDNETVEEIRQAVVSALAKNESDTELVKRLKMAGEGAVLGSTIDLLAGLYRGTRAVIRSMRGGGGAEQSVVRAIDDATRQLEELQAEGVEEVLERIAAGRRLLRDRTPIREGVARDNESFQGASDLIKTMAQHDYTLAKSISSGLSEARYLTFHGPQYRMSKKGRAEFFREFKTANAPFSGEIDIRVAGHSGPGRAFGGAPHFQWSINAPSSENVTRISDMMMRLSDLSAQHPFGGGTLPMKGDVKEFTAEGVEEVVTIETRRVGNVIEISKITTPEKLRGTGLAEKELQALINKADTEGITLALTPSDAFGASKSRLTKWYKRHGFVPNRGRNKDFTTREALIRPAELPPPGGEQ